MSTDRYAPKTKMRTAIQRVHERLDKAEARLNAIRAASKVMREQVVGDNPELPTVEQWRSYWALVTGEDS